MKNYIYTIGVLLTFGFISCDVNNELDEIPAVVVPEVPLTAGSADFSNYVAVGASFTAGYTDGAMFAAAQTHSFPNILASKFANAGGGNFNQPIMVDVNGNPSNTGGLLYGGTVIAGPRLYFNGSGPAALSAAPTTETTNVLSGPFNNMGVPGAKSFHLLAPGFGGLANVPLGLANPYFARMASSQTATVLEDVVAQNPTFFTLSEIGGNDVLGYATTGGDGTNPITDSATFDFAFNTIVNALTANGAKGVVANIPYVTSLAHFTTIPYNPVPLDAATATLLNQGYAPYNGGLQAAAAALAGTGLLSDEEVAKRTITFAAGQNAMVIIDESLTDLGAINPAFAAIPKYRQATAEDLFVLPLSSLIPAGYGTQIPLEDKWVLTPEEQNEIKVATDAYNATIESVASAKGLAFVDFKTLLIDAAANGYTFDNYTMTTNLVTGGLISLDGIHLTARGYAMMAKEILEAIDETYGSNFAEATNGLPVAGDYPTNYSPTLQ